MDSAMNRFFSIIELVDHLIQFLDYKGISRLMQTSNRLNTLCTPVYYHDLKVTYAVNKRQLFSSAESTQALARNAHHVRQLSFEAREVVYYTNCVFTYQDQLLLQQTTATGASDLPQEPYFQPQRPLWLAPPDSLTSPVFPISPMTLLTKLEIKLDYSSDAPNGCRYRLSRFTDPKATLTYICWIMDSNPHLLDVKLYDILIKNQRDIRLLTTSIFGLKKLQRLTLFPSHYVGWALPSDLASTFFFSCPSSLQSFEFIVIGTEEELHGRFSALWDYIHTPQEQLQPWEKDEAECGLPEKAPRRQDLLTHLTRLNIYDGRNDSFSEDLLRAMLAHCPNLTHISMPKLTEIRNPQGLAQDIAQLCPRLKSVQNYGEEGDATAAPILQLLGMLPPQQVESLSCIAQPPFVVSGFGDLGGLFRRHSSTMRSIEIHSSHNIGSKTIQTILVECEALEQLSVDWGLSNSWHQLRIVLEDAIEAPWACTRIQELALSVAIPDEPFHHLTEDRVPYYERPAPTALFPDEKEQLSSLKDLYRQIGALKELHSLHLHALFYDPKGVRSVSSDDQATTFPAMLSLGCEETGRPGFLHHLAGLTKLKLLYGSVSAETRETRTTIGMEEVVWMEQHWPVLQEGGFLSRGSRNNIPKIFRWWKEQRAGKRFFIDA